MEPILHDRVNISHLTMTLEWDGPESIIIVVLFTTLILHLRREKSKSMFILLSDSWVSSQRPLVVQEIKVIGLSQSHLEFNERPRFQTLWEGNSAPAFYCVGYFCLFSFRLGKS